ncbi:MAG: hypothetical protein Q4C03_02290 [bacterium]|nr:hypothetical protein [bacterium]
MATLDDILGGSPPSGGNAPKGSAEWADQNSGDKAGSSGGNAPKGSAEWADQNSGDKAPVSSTPKQPAEKKPASTGQTSQMVGGYEDLYKRLNPYTPPTEEELAKERKRQKTESIIAAVSDGIAAMSNLFFATQYAPNMYTGKNTLSERTKIRYDKLMKEREEKNTAYFNGMLKARQADQEAAHRERSWQRQLGLDAEAQRRYEESIQHRNEREQIADERYNAEQEYKKGRDEEADRRWQATFDEDKRRSDRSYNFQKQQHSDNVTLKKEANRATAARGVRGKQLGFADGQGNQVSIYENVWKGSMQQVYDAMLEDLAPTDEAELKRYQRDMKKLDTPAKKEDYVKQNWHKSPKASQIMLTLSGIDPATMTSELYDEVEDYTPSNEEVIDYVPGK